MESVNSEHPWPSLKGSHLQCWSGSRGSQAPCCMGGMTAYRAGTTGRLTTTCSGAPKLMPWRRGQLPTSGPCALPPLPSALQEAPRTPKGSQKSKRLLSGLTSSGLKTGCRAAWQGCSGLLLPSHPGLRRMRMGAGARGKGLQGAGPGTLVLAHPVLVVGAGCAFPWEWHW